MAATPELASHSQRADDGEASRPAAKPFDYTTALRDRAHSHAPGSANPAYLKLIRHRPFVLNVETVSICNAKCCFCPYPTMQRTRGYMPAALYRKIISEYDELGGGALLLTPILGDFLLDKQAMERIRVAREFTRIGNISLTTNAIAFDRYSDSELEYFIESTDYLQISLGGVDRHQYRRMFGVDQFDRVKRNVIRFAELRRRLRPDYPLRLTFRVDCSAESLRERPEFRPFADLDAEIVVDQTYGNWGGSVDQTALPVGAFMRDVLPPGERSHPCFMLYLGIYVAASGKVTACGCMDAEIALEVGDCSREHLGEIWTGARRAFIRDAFGSDRVPAICRSCSFYQDGEAFLRTPEVVNFREGRFPFGY